MIEKIAFNTIVSFGSPMFPVPVGAIVTVTNAETNLPADVYADSTGAFLANPFPTTESGKILFYHDAGRFDIAISSPEGVVTFNDYVSAGRKKRTVPTPGSVVVLNDQMHDLKIELTESGPVTVQVDGNAPLSDGTDIHVYRPNGLIGNVTFEGINGQAISAMDGLDLVIENEGIVTVSQKADGAAIVYGSLRKS